MSQNPLETIKELEQLVAWHRINVERAGADWVWEARLRTAEDLERRAAEIRARNCPMTGDSGERPQRNTRGAGMPPPRRERPSAILT